MLKVHILSRWMYYDCQAYLPAGDATNWKAETYTRYASCQMCNGTGESGQWVWNEQVKMLDIGRFMHNEAKCKSAHDYPQNKKRSSHATPVCRSKHDNYRRISWRRGRDLNPRSLAGNTLSRRAR